MATSTNFGSLASTGSNQDAFYKLEPEQKPALELPANRVKRKRNRVPVACFNCRSLKTKCDGLKPVCSTCTASGEACQYSTQGIAPSATSVVINQDYLSSLERRLAQIERRSISETVDDASSHSGTINLPATPTTFNNVPVTPVSSARPSIGISADQDVLMGGVNFTQLIVNAMDSRTVGIHAHSPNLTRDESFAIKPSEIFNLPPNAREMLQIFIARRHQLSPLFHVPTIRNIFDEAIACEVSKRSQYRYILAIMNMMFALSASHQILDDLVPPYIARRYYDVGIELLRPTLLQDWSLEKVQALVLGSRYLQSSNCPDECWNILGLAIRIAHGLELHRPPPDSDGYNIRETKKRTWNACYTLDRLLSMVYSRPQAISSTEKSCPLPEDLDDEFISETEILRPTPPRSSGMAFSIETAKLYRIMESATELHKADIVNGEILAQQVVSLDERYQKWYNALPSQLILNSEKVYEPPLVLALRANMVRMLIHRQSLALILRGIKDQHQRLNDTIKSGMLQHSREICVKAAMETIFIVSLRHESSQKASGPSWFNLYYLFNSILILVSHILDPSYHNDKLALSRLDLGFNMITTMSVDHAFAQRAHAFLTQLLGIMDKSISKAAPPLPPPPQQPLSRPSSTSWAPPHHASHYQGHHHQSIPSPLPPPISSSASAASPIGTHIYHGQPPALQQQQAQTSHLRDEGTIPQSMAPVQEMVAPQGTPHGGHDHAGHHPNTGPTDIYALFGYTQDLTQSLGSQLNNYENVGQGMGSWDWNMNGFGPGQGGV